MTEERPIVRESTDEFERLLLGSARLDAPVPGARTKLLLALGATSATAAIASTAEAAGSVLTASSGAAAVSVVGTAGGVAASSAGSAAGAVAGAGVGVASLAKWLGVGVLVGGALSTSAAVTLSDHTAERASEQASRITPTPRAQGTSETSVAGGTHTSTERDTTPDSEQAEVSVASPQGAAATAPKTAAAPDSNDIVVELSLLDDARKALGRGDGSAALRALSARDKRVGAGVLEPESQVLRIEALIASGRNAEGTRAAREFLRAHAQSPHAPRVRSLLAKADRAASDTPRPVPVSVPPPATPTADEAPAGADSTQSTKSFPLP